MTDHAGWQGLLDEGETILWQGRPDKGIRWFDGDVTSTLMGVVMVCFALFWMFKAAQADTLMWVFGFLFLIVGARQTIAGNIVPAYIRSRSWYTLTDRRAIIATDIPVRGRRLTTVPITPQTEITLEAGSPGSILFGPPTRALRRGEAFLLIPEAVKVMGLIRQIQTAPLAPFGGHASAPFGGHLSAPSGADPFAPSGAATQPLAKDAP